MNKMKKNDDHKKNESVPTRENTWESRGLIADVHKTLDSTLPPMKIDIASTLGVSTNLPLAVKKDVRYWFGPEIKTKTHVVKYINQICRHNGFKISTLSNSKQGLDRRAQLVCSRGIIARKPRGKSQTVQTTTTRPVSVDEKCPFSLTVYECRKSGRWYIRKYGNGSRMHCGHYKLLPQQVGIRKFQNLTERAGEDWSNEILDKNEKVCRRVTETDEKLPKKIDPISATKNSDKNNEAGGRLLATDDKSSKPNPNVKTSDPPTQTEPLGLSALNTATECQDQQQNQIFDYVDGPRDRMAFRDYSDQLLLERARRLEADMMDRFGWSSSSIRHHQFEYLGASSDNHRLWMDRIGALSRSNPTNIDLDLLEYTRGNSYVNDRVSRYLDRPMLSNHVGMHEVLSLKERNETLRHGVESGRYEDASTEQLLDMIARTVQNDFPSRKDAKNSASQSQEGQPLRNFVRYGSDDGRKSIRNDQGFCKSHQPRTKSSTTALDDGEKCADSTTVINGEINRRSESASESGKIDSCTITSERGQVESVRSKLFNQVSPSERSARDRVVPESARSSTLVGSNKRENNSEDRIEKRKKLRKESRGSQKPTTIADCIGSDSGVKVVKESEPEPVDKSSVQVDLVNRVENKAREGTKIRKVSDESIQSTAIADCIGSNSRVETVEESEQESVDHSPVRGDVVIRAENNARESTEIWRESDGSQKPTAIADCIGSDSRVEAVKEKELEPLDQSSGHGDVFNRLGNDARENTTTNLDLVDDYAMLRPMAIYNYPSG